MSAARPPVRRSWGDVAVLAVAAAVLLLTSVLAWDRAVPSAERSVFTALNGSPGPPYAVVWTVMQLGNVLTVLAVALVAAVRGRLRLSASLVAGGLTAYVLAKVVKALVDRPRPPALLADVQVRGPEVADPGFVSGHTAVATVLVVLLVPVVSRRTAWLLAVLALGVGVARVHVGAHLPLDVVGGAALAAGVAAAVRLALGGPRGRPGRPTARSGAPAVAEDPGHLRPGR